MKCKLCGINTQCMCKWGGCKQCKQTNPQVEYTNKVIDLWTDKNLILENLESMKLRQRLRIDPYTIWDKLVHWTPFPEDVQNAVDTNTPMPRTSQFRAKEWKKVRIEPFEMTRNPNITCDFWWDRSPWAKCKYCNSIQRYIKWKVCPAFNLNNEENVQQL